MGTRCSGSTDECLEKLIEINTQENAAGAAMGFAGICQAVGTSTDRARMGRAGPQTHGAPRGSAAPSPGMRRDGAPAQVPQHLSAGSGAVTDVGEPPWQAACLQGYQAIKPEWR